jgi:hypothetical protein
MGIILLYLPILKLSCRTNIVAVVAKKLSQEKDEKRKMFLSFYNSRVFVDLNTFWSTIWCTLRSSQAVLHLVRSHFLPSLDSNSFLTRNENCHFWSKYLQLLWFQTFEDSFKILHLIVSSVFVSDSKIKILCVLNNKMSTTLLHLYFIHLAKPNFCHFCWSIQCRKRWSNV